MPYASLADRRKGLAREGMRKRRERARVARKRVSEATWPPDPAEAVIQWAKTALAVENASRRPVDPRQDRASPRGLGGDTRRAGRQRSSGGRATASRAIVRGWTALSRYGIALRGRRAGIRGSGGRA